MAFYSDKFGVFGINHPNDGCRSTAFGLQSDGVTQFARALCELDIELICANTPQAKGRGGRANQTLQDRLVKELRLRGISDLPAANVFLPEFRADLKRRFAVQPRESQDAHRPLQVSDDLTRILALRELRTLFKNLTLNYNRDVYQIHSPRPTYALRHAKVEVRERWDGTLHILYRDKPLDYAVHREPPRQAELISSKELNPTLDARARRGKRSRVQVPPADHPWRKFKYGRSSTQP